MNFSVRMKSKFMMNINKNRTLSITHLGIALVYLIA